MTMRRTTRNIAAMIACALAGIAVSNGCSNPAPATQFTVGVMTQILVPKDLRAIRITASAGGQRGFCQTYPVVEGKARLPKSLALAPLSDPSLTVTVTVMGFSIDKDVLAQNPNPVGDDCTIPTVSPSDAFDPNAKDPSSTPPPEARILRRSRQSYVDSRNIYVPMPLYYSCYGVNCTGSQVCKGGACASSEVDVRTLPDFDDALLFGTTSACFALSCLDDAVGPDVVDAAACVYEVPLSMSPVAHGLNVRAIYDGFRVEVLDLDKDEGFFLPDPANHPNRFQLAPSLCHGGAGLRIRSLAASRACPSKNVYQPICAEDSKMITLSPLPSAMYILTDLGSSMQDYVGPTSAKSASSALGQVLGLALADPVFMNTQLAFRFVPGSSGNECTDKTYATPINVTGAPFIDAASGIGPISKLIETTPVVATSTLGLNAVLPQALAVQFPAKDGGGRTITYNKKAIVLVTNRTLDPSTAANCPGDAAAAVTTAAQSGIDTYVFSLRNAAEPDQSARISAGNSFAAAAPRVHLIDATGGSTGDATTSQLAAANGVGAVVSSLASCLYDKPADFTDATTGKLTLRSPVTPSGELPFDATCGTTPTANGWAIEGDHIRVCGQTCNLIGDAIKANAAVTAQRNQSGDALASQVRVVLQPR